MNKKAAGKAPENQDGLPIGPNASIGRERSRLSIQNGIAGTTRRITPKRRRKSEKSGTIRKEINGTSRTETKASLAVPRAKRKATLRLLRS